MAEKQDIPSNSLPPPYSGYSSNLDYSRPDYGNSNYGNYGVNPGSSSNLASVSTVSATSPAYRQPVMVTQPVYGAVTVPDNFGLAVFATLCCFWPLGIFAIMKASESKTALARGDVQAALTASNESRRLSLISVGIGIVAIIAVIVAVVVVVVNNNTYYYYG